MTTETDFLLIKKPISPTLANFLGVPYFTKMNEEEIVISLWHYILDHRLLHDERLLLLDKKLEPVVHPGVYWGDSESFTESSIVMIFVAKMHQDSAFIDRDVERRLQKLKEQRAARTIVKFLREHCNVNKSQHVLPNNGTWVSFLANKYGHPRQEHSTH